MGNRPAIAGIKFIHWTKRHCSEVTSPEAIFEIAASALDQRHHELQEAHKIGVKNPTPLKHGEITLRRGVWVCVRVRVWGGGEGGLERLKKRKPDSEDWDKPKSEGIWKICIISHPKKKIWIFWGAGSCTPLPPTILTLKIETFGSVNGWGDVSGGGMGVMCVLGVS
jgi:hypothetical protein